MGGDYELNEGSEGFLRGSGPPERGGDSLRELRLSVRKGEGS